MSSGGGNFFDDAVHVNSLSGKGNFFQNLGNDVLNYAVQYGTYGTVGFQDGKLGEGAAIKGVKVLTGAKAAEDANKIATQQFEEQKTAAETDRQNSYRQAGLQQIQQSQMAQAARNTGTANNSTNNSANNGSKLGGDEKDFLGV